MNRPENNSLGLLAVFSFGMFVLALVYHMLIGGRGFLAAVLFALIFALIIAALIYLFLMTTLGMEWSQAAKRKIEDKAVEVKGKIGDARAPGGGDAGDSAAAAPSLAHADPAPEPELAPEPDPVPEPEPAPEPEPEPSVAAAALEDYDGDGVGEGTGEGTRPGGLDAPRGGQADDLKMIKGVGPKLEKQINSMGFWHFDQVAAWTADEVAWVNANLPGFPGRVSRDNWVGQAKTLAAGGETEFSKRVEGGDVY